MFWFYWQTVLMYLSIIWWKYVSKRIQIPMVIVNSTKVFKEWYNESIPHFCSGFLNLIDFLLT